LELEEELIETVKPHNEITCATLHKIGVKKVMTIIGFLEQKKKKGHNSQLKVLLLMLVVNIQFRPDK